jgi:putative transcriptional regulator
LHSCYVACMLYRMSRQKEEPVFNRVEDLRTAKGMSRQQLADAVGVHYQTIGYLERGEYSPSLILALKIAKALDAEIPDIFSIKPFRKGN